MTGAGVVPDELALAVARISSYPPEEPLKQWAFCMLATKTRHL
jgi:hypothetical protein